MKSRERRPGIVQPARSVLTEISVMTEMTDTSDISEKTEKTTGGGGTPTGGVGLNVYPPFPTAPHF